MTKDDGKGPIKMPNTAYLGFSAHTGELSDNFDIVTVDTKNLYNAAASNRGPQGGPSGRGPSSNAFKGSKKQSSGGWGWFLFKLIIFVGVAGGGYVGYNAYRTKKRKEYRGF